MQERTEDQLFNQEKLMPDLCAIPSIFKNSYNVKQLGPFFCLGLKSLLGFSAGKYIIYITKIRIIKLTGTIIAKEKKIFFNSIWAQKKNNFC